MMTYNHHPTTPDLCIMTYNHHPTTPDLCMMTYNHHPTTPVLCIMTYNDHPTTPLLCIMTYNHHPITPDLCIMIYNNHPTTPDLCIMTYNDHPPSQIFVWWSWTLMLRGEGHFTPLAASIATGVLQLIWSQSCSLLPWCDCITRTRDEQGCFVLKLTRLSYCGSVYSSAHVVFLYCETNFSWRSEHNTYIFWSSLWKKTPKRKYIESVCRSLENR